MYVVTGATGNVGRALVAGLAARGETVAAVSRNAPGSELPEGVSHHVADLAEPEGMVSVFDNAAALFLLVAGDDPAGILDRAVRSGVARVVLLSTQGAGTRPEGYAHALAFECAVKESGLDWTILRPGGFATNAFRWADRIRTRREVAAPFADVPLPAIDPADIADVAAVVLTGGGHSARTYELTGPQALSPRQRVQAVADAIGEEIRFVEQTRDEARAQLLGFMPEAVADATLGILGSPEPVEQAVSPDVERVLGRAPHSFADWAQRHAVAFR